MPASWARAAERSVVNGHAEDVVPFTVTGFSLRVGEREFCKPADGPRAAARWRQVIDLLHREGAIEYASSSAISDGPLRVEFEYWRLTAAGYLLADVLKEP